MIKSEILLTIGIPTFNGDCSISETLDSIVSQDCTDIEVLVMDNASTDNTLKIVKQYEEKYNFIRHIKNETNVGYDKNYNLTIFNANGRFVWTVCVDSM
jgi:glycosyltransferase involved in cell wall biosynthesis